MRRVWKLKDFLHSVGMIEAFIFSCLWLLLRVTDTVGVAVGWFLNCWTISSVSRLSFSFARSIRFRAHLGCGMEWMNTSGLSSILLYLAYFKVSSVVTEYHLNRSLFRQMATDSVRRSRESATLSRVLRCWSIDKLGSAPSHLPARTACRLRGFTISPKEDMTSEAKSDSWPSFIKPETPPDEMTSIEVQCCTCWIPLWYLPKTTNDPSLIAWSSAEGNPGFLLMYDAYFSNKSIFIFPK